MTHHFKTANYDLTYTQSHVNNCVLRENHCHAHYEMIAVLEGDIRLTLEGRVYRLQKNQAIIIPPLCYHAVTSNQEGTYQRITALFDRKAVPDALQTDFTKKDRTPVIFPFPKDGELRRIFESAPTPYYEPYLESMMTLLLYKRIRTPATDDVHSEADRITLEIISYIDAHLCEEITLDSLAKHTSRSKSSVCHVFEQQMGVSPIRYILQKRMAYAEQQIRAGRSATEVAAALGYKSYAAFYRMYQKHCGISPQKTKTEKG